MKFFRRRTLDERLMTVVVRALEQQYPLPWISLSESRQAPRVAGGTITHWDLSYSAMHPDSPELILTIGIRGVPKWLH